MYSEAFEIPYFSLSPTSLTLFTMLEGGTISARQKDSWKNLDDNANKYGELSEHSVKRLRRAINYMIYTTKEKQIQGKIITSKTQNFETLYEKTGKHQKPVNYKLALITLTLPSSQRHPDEEIKSKLLNQFLIELKKSFQVREYIWKAEKQDNGNIHFHILINRYIHHQKIKTLWNRICEKLNYISNYRQNMLTYFAEGFRVSTNPNDKRSIAAQERAYHTGVKENWLQPNSTDIHALYKVKNASAYLVKYLAKGVTKTERIQAIQKIRNENKAHAQRIEEIDKELFYLSTQDQKAKHLFAQIDTLRNRIEENEKQLEKLLSAGVTGRIWGQSQSLSKISNLVDCARPEDIPQFFEVISSADKHFESKIGARSIDTYIFDVTKFDTLNEMLKTHIASSSAVPPAQLLQALCPP